MLTLADYAIIVMLFHWLTDILLLLLPCETALVQLIQQNLQS